MSNDTKQNSSSPKHNSNNDKKVLDIIADKVAPERHVPVNERLAILSPEQKMQLQQIEDETIMHFNGSIDELESALGMLRIGYHFGWKVLYLAHSKKTVRKYEKILNIKIRELFPELGPSSKRSIGMGLAEKVSNFWKVVSGEIKIENRREIE